MERADGIDVRAAEWMSRTPPEAEPDAHRAPTPSGEPAPTIDPAQAGGLAPARGQTPAIHPGRQTPPPAETIGAWIEDGEASTSASSPTRAPASSPAPAPEPSPVPPAHGPLPASADRIALAAWESEADPVLARTAPLADDLDDWLQGPIEQQAEQEAEDAWSTAAAVSRRQMPSDHTPAPAVSGTAPVEGSAATAPADPAPGAARTDAPGATDTTGTPSTASAPGSATVAGRTRPVFRSELHGLRAVALTLVAIYHIWLGRVSGGVDVFLFLSAFFLTGTFVRRLESGRPLGVPRYWLHTFKRLLPPAAVTILAVLAASAWLLPASLWPTVMQQAAASIGYVQNLLLVAQEVDYQARDAGASSPLQHFWSLSVQGQAFLLWPLLFLLALPRARRAKPVRRPLLLLMAVLVAASLTWSIIETREDQPVAYFDTLARLWEFAAGSMLALALPWIDRMTGARRPEDSERPRHGPARLLLGWGGLFGLLACGIVLNVSSVFPGWIAIWPLTAAGAVVVAGHSGSRLGVDRLLSTRPAAFIGDISYALYLVHWPILVLWLHHSGQERAGVVDGLLVLLGSGVVAWLLTRLVDAPIRHSAWLEARPRRALTAVAVSIALVLGTAGGWWGVLRSQQPEETARQVFPIDEVATAAPPQILPKGWDLADQWPDLPHRCAGPWTPQHDFPHVHCQQLLPGDATASATLVVVGSSHARQLIPALLPQARRHGWQIVNLSMDGCELKDPAHEGAYCAGYHDHAISYLRRTTPEAVLTTSTRTAPDSPREQVPAGTPAAIQHILDLGIDVLAVRDTPRWPTDQYQCPEAVIDADGTPEDADAACGAALTTKQAAADPGTVLARLTGAAHPTARRPASVTLVDPSSAVCPGGRCSPVLGDTYVYLDDNHLTRLFVERALPPVIGPAALRTALGARITPASSDGG